MPKISELPSLTTYDNSGISDMSFVVNGNDSNGDYITGQFSGENFTEFITDVIHEYLSENVYGYISEYASEGNLDEYLSSYISSYISDGNISDYISECISSYVSGGNIDDYLSSFLSSYMSNLSTSSDEELGTILVYNGSEVCYADMSAFTNSVFRALYYDPEYMDYNDSCLIPITDDIWSSPSSNTFGCISLGDIVNYVRDNL